MGVSSPRRSKHGVSFRLTAQLPGSNGVGTHSWWMTALPSPMLRHTQHLSLTSHAKSTVCRPAGGCTVSLAGLLPLGRLFRQHHRFCILPAFGTCVSSFGFLAWVSCNFLGGCHRF